MNTPVGLSGQILPDDMKDQNTNNNSPKIIDKKLLKWIVISCVAVGIIVAGIIVLIKFLGSANDANNKKDSDTQAITGQSSIISVTTGQALVILDGKSTSRFTPFSLSGLKDGKHSLWLSSEKGDWQADINIESNNIKNINAVIGNQTEENNKKNSEILLSSNPVGASIFLDDEQLDEVTPSRIEGLSPGNHKISLMLNGYSSWEEEIAVTSGTTISFSAILGELEYADENREDNIITEFTRVNSGWRKFENLTYAMQGEIPEDWNVYELKNTELELFYENLSDKAEYQDAEMIVVFDDNQEDDLPIMAINISSLSEDQLIENMINFYGDQIEIEDSENGKILKTIAQDEQEEKHFVIMNDENNSYNFLIFYKTSEDTFGKFMDAFQILEDAENL